MRRPLFFVSLMQAAIGILFLEFGIQRAIALLIFISSIPITIFSVSKRHISKGTPEIYSEIFKIFIVFIMAVGLLCNGYFVMEKNIKAVEKFMERYNGEEVELECIVIHADKTDNRKMKVVAYPFIGNSYNGKILLNCYSLKNEKSEMENIVPGDHIIIRGKFQVPRSASNPRCFDYRNYLMGEKIFLTCTCVNLERTFKECGLVWKMRRFTEDIRRNFFKGAFSSDPEVGGVIRGIVLGDKAALNEDIYDRFRLYGTAHILAVSGLHIGILVTVYRRIYRSYPNRILIYILLVALFFYGQITRWSPSVFRAVSMSLIYVGSQVLKRDFDLLTALGISGIISVGLNPGILLSLSFKMSYLAILGIGIVGRRIAARIEIYFQRRLAYICGEEPIRKLSSWAGMYFGVQIVMTPFILHEFNYLTPFGIFLNLPIGILAGIIVSVGILLMGLTAFEIQNFIPQFVKLIETELYYLGKILINIHEFNIDKLLSRNINMWLQMISPGLTFIVMAILLILLVFSESFYIMLSRKRLLNICVSLCVIVILGGISYFADKSNFDHASIVMVDVGQGDCMHIRSRNGDNMVFDGGGSKDKSIGKLILLPYFLRNRVARLDMACVTHRDTDHAKGLYDLRKLYKISRFVDGAYAGNLATGNGTSVDVVWPFDDSKGVAGDNNELSSVYRIDVDGISVLVTGDIGEDTEREIVNKYKNSDILKADVLKVAHHGSRYSTTDDFLKAVDPKVAVIGVGKNNYGHPAGSVIDKLEKNDIMTYRTDLDGAIGIWKENGSLKVCTMLRK